MLHHYIATAWLTPDIYSGRRPIFKGSSCSLAVIAAVAFFFCNDGYACKGNTLQPNKQILGDEIGRFCRNSQ